MKTSRQNNVRLACLLHAIALTLWSATPAPAQGTRADYERARNLRKLTDNKVSRDRVQPAWLPGDAQFWYRVKTGADTHEFVLVNAEKGERKPAFDHARLARALTDAGVQGARADRLPLDELKFKLAEDAVRFDAGGKSWHCNLKTYELSEQPSSKDGLLPALPAQDAPGASARTGPETSLTFINRTPNEVELFWLDADGEQHSYGKLNAGEQREQHTFAGHVWL